MESFDFSKFSLNTLAEFAKDLLNVAHNRNLIRFTTESGVKYKPTLIEYDSTVEKATILDVDTIVDVIGTAGISKAVADSLFVGLQKYYDRYFPREIIILYFSKINPDLKSYFEKGLESIASDIEILDIDWIEKELSNNPEVLEKYLSGSNSSNVNIEKSINLKHALSTNENDEDLIKKGYVNQGFIGYIHSKKLPKTKPLYQEYIIDWNDYIYYVDIDLEDIPNFKTSEKKIIGYLALESERSDLELFRYFKEETFDHICCVLPKKNLLLELKYKLEPNKGFEGTYLLPPQGKDISPLYVYSTKSDPKLFTSPNLGPNKKQIQEFIASKIRSESNFWWLQAKSDRWVIDELEIGETTSYHSKNANGKLQRHFKDFSIGDLVIGYQGSPDAEIKGLFEIESIDLKAETTFKLIYLFEDKTSIKDLKSIDLFNNHQISTVKTGSIFSLSPELFKAIINTTEIKIEVEQELDEGDNLVDNIPFHLDQVENTDRLNREPIAKSISGLLNKQIFSTSLEKSIWKRLLIIILSWLKIHEIKLNLKGFPEWVKTNIESIKKEKESRHAFMIHLQGAWGDGKSTFLNLIESNLDTQDRKWIVVKFNAWQHQQITPPWWSFLEQIYIQSNLGRFKNFLLWISESRRRLLNMKTIYNLLTFLIVVLAGFLIIYFNPSITKFYISDANKELTIGEQLINLSKVIAAIGTLMGLIYAGARFLAQPLLLRSPQSAKSFMQLATDPMVTVKKHFEALISNIEVLGYRVAIFIDDLDRCNASFAVELLEGIQTLYKDRKVLYLVAGDKNWISECFENQYIDFSNVAKEPGQKLGYLFLEKAFQLSIRLPQITGKVKDKYWQFILDPNNSTNVEKGREVETKEKPDRTPEETQELKVKFKQRFNKQEYSSPEQIESITEELGVTDTEATDMGLEIMNEDAVDVKHRLLNHSELIEANPRSIKRLANQYNVYRDILFAERREFDPDKLFRWLIIQNAYPVYADLVEKDSKVYEKNNLPKELEGLKENLHWHKLVMDAKKERGGKLMIKDIQQFIGAEKETPTA